MDVTSAEVDYLKELVDDLRVAHQELLDHVDALRVERDTLRGIAHLASAYTQSHLGLNELDPMVLLKELSEQITAYARTLREVS
jgi:hypothetical protein